MFMLQTNERPLPSKALGDIDKDISETEDEDQAAGRRHLQAD